MFLPEYIARGVLKQDPFVSIDRDGVGELIKIAAERGRSTRPKLKLGICGEHGRRPGIDPALSRSGAQLRVMFAVPRAGGAPCRCASGAQANDRTRRLSR